MYYTKSMYNPPLPKEFAPHELYELSQPVSDLKSLYPRLKRGKDNKSKSKFYEDQKELELILEGNGEINFSKYMSKQFLENLQDYVRETVDDRDKKYELRMNRMGDKNIAKRKEHEEKNSFLE